MTFVAFLLHHLDVIKSYRIALVLRSKKMGSHNRRHLRPKFVHVGTLGVAAGAIALAGQASAQSVHVDGRLFVAISLSGWQ